MKIGIAGPMTLDVLKEYLPDNNELPYGYPSPMPAILISSLIKNGHDVVAFTTSTDIAKSLVIHGEKLTICIAKRKQHAGRYFFHFERKELISLMKEYPVDVINAQWSYEFAWAALKVNKNAVVTLRDHAFNIFKYSPDLFRLVRLLMNYITLIKVKHIIFNSEYLYEKIKKRNNKKFKVVKNFLSKELLISHNEIKKENYILTVSNGFGYLKNIKKALKGYSQFRKFNNNFDYYLIGDDMEENGKAHKYAKQSGLELGVKFLGRLSYNETLEKIKKAKILLHPSIEESFCMVVLEAMALGTLVIGGHKSGNIPYLLKNGELGYLCNMKKIENISEKLMNVISNYEENSYMISKTQIYVRDEYSEEKQLNKLLEYYLEIIKKNS